MERELDGATPDQFAVHKKAEAARVWELYQVGTIRELYFRQDQHTAVLVLECDNVGQAREILNKLPLVRERLITFDLIPLIPYSGFSRLFTAPQEANT